MCGTFNLDYWITVETYKHETNRRANVYSTGNSAESFLIDLTAYSAGEKYRSWWLWTSCGHAKLIQRKIIENL